MRNVELTRRATLVAAVGVMVAPSGAMGIETKDKKAMERVQGIGGFFFKAKDPKGLAKWYADNLGVTLTPGDYNSPAWETEAGTTVFQPFPQDTTYFGEARQQWMLNFRVRSLDKMTVQLRANGIAVEVDGETYPNGRFASIADPEGNPIQLWEPKQIVR